MVHDNVSRAAEPPRRLSIRLNALRYRRTVVDALGQRIMKDVRIDELP